VNKASSFFLLFLWKIRGNGMEMKEGLIALDHIEGLGWQSISRMLEFGWSPDQELSKELLDYLYQSKTSKKGLVLLKKHWHPSWIRQVNDQLKKNNIIAITLLDESYPPLLKEISQPPWVLYIRGNPQLLTEEALAVVGTRKPSPYGIQVTNYLCTQLVRENWMIISGMAHGIDAAAHRSVLAAEGKTIAVLGTGVDVIYPRNHCHLYEQIIQTGAVISEMPPGTRAHPGLFPRRNRIISGLSQGTLVIEAAERSGSLITASFSLEQGREVFAVPGSIFSPNSKGTLKLIQDGAKCVTSVQDILDEFPDYTRPKAKKQNENPLVLSEMEEKLLKYITEEPLQLATLIDQIADQLTTGEIHQALLSLQLKKYIKQLPGSYYIRNHQP
jgi:DNA processing protein